MKLKVLSWLLSLLAIWCAGYYFDNGEFIAGMICVFSLGLLIPPLREKLNKQNEEKEKTANVITLKQGVIGGFVFIFVAFVIGAPSSDAEEQKDNSEVQFLILSVSDYEFTLNNKKAVTISFGENQENYCEITIVKKSIYAGSKVKSIKNDNKDLSASCQWNESYYVQSSKHNTFVGFKIESINENETQIITTVNLIDTKKDMYFNIHNISVVLNKNQTETLLLK